MRRLLVAACVLVALGAGLYRIHRHPPRIAHTPPEARARRPGSSGDGDVVVVVDDAAPPPPRTLRLEWPYAWLNTVQQEFGPCVLVQARDLDRGSIQGRRVVVLPADAQPALVPSAWKMLREATVAGLTLLIERPAGRSGVDLPESLGVAPAPGAADRSPAWQALQPALARLWPPGSAWPPTWAPIGRGAVVEVRAPFARTLVEVQQTSRRMADESPPAHGLTPSEMPQASSFLSDTVLRRIGIPAMDGLEHRLALELMAAGPLPRLWPAPAGARGAFLVTHDSELMGDRSTWMAEASAALGEPCTYFLADTGFTPRGIARLESLGADLGFHWDRTRTGWRTHRLGRLRLYLRQRSAADQLEGLRSKGFRPGPEGLLNRNHYLAMTSSGSHFRNMAALGVTLDSSFGPDATFHGYPFATQLPFHPLDENGYPFEMVELPFQYADYFGGVDSIAIQAMLRHTAEVDHGALVALYHPNLFDGRGRLEAFVDWWRSYGWARAAGLWVGRMSEYQGFWRRRTHARLVSTWRDPELQITAGVGDSLQTLVLPVTWQGRRLRRVWLRESPLPWNEQTRWGEPQALLRLPQGETALRAEYAPR